MIKSLRHKENNSKEIKNKWKITHYITGIEINDSMFNRDIRNLILNLTFLKLSTNINYALIFISCFYEFFYRSFVICFFINIKIIFILFLLLSNNCFRFSTFFYTIVNDRFLFSLFQNELCFLESFCILNSLLSIIFFE